MSDDYLWDRSGTPDPEIEQLERSLARLGHPGGPLDLDATGEAAAPAREPRRAGARAGFVWPWERPALPHDRPRLGVPTRAWAAAAAALMLLAAGAIVLVTLRTPAWPVARLAGAPSVGTRALAGDGRLAVGEWLLTDGASRARVTVGEIGEVIVEPRTRLRLLEAGERRQRLELEVGTVMAVIVAPPRQFVVETPSARAVDLGCAYTLEVDPRGAALVTVIAGWVSFERDGRESFIPAGARCATRPGVGPGTPYFTDARHGFKNALVLLDVAGAGDPTRAARLATVLAEARREDAFTLWHLITRTDGAEREAVVARLAELAPPPAGVTREGARAGDRAMLDRWWDELGFGDTGWWRMWRRAWPEPGPSAAGPS